MELQHLKTFSTVATAGSLTRAAELLFLTQPAVSGQIKALEVELGVQLFRRASRGMILTAAGEELLKLAQDVVARADGVLRLAERLREGVSGTLRLGTVDTGIDLKLARIIGRMSQQHPGAEVQLTASNSGTQYRALLDEHVDMAIIEGDFDAGRVKSWRLGTSRLGVLAPAAWASQVRDASWAQLGEFPWVFHSVGCSNYTLLQRISEQQGVQFKPQFHVEAFGAAKELVAEGLALAISDLDDAAPLVDSGELIVWPGLVYDMPVSLLVLRSRAEEPMLKAFATIATAVHRWAPSAAREERSGRVAEAKSRA